MDDINSFKTSKSTLRKLLIEQTKKYDHLEAEYNHVKNNYEAIINSGFYKFFLPYRKLRSFVPNKAHKADPINQPTALEPLGKYCAKYEDNIDFSQLNYSSSAKVLAFYLPQFYCFKENNEWWGDGFTEWTNTKKAKPHFSGHYQPREPHDDFGYYSLDDASTIRKQVSLAKQHGIYGFCFYYYWFSGKRLLDKPLDLFLENKDIDCPFCLCWANENWTRTWDGLEKNVLIEQKYNDNDACNFITDLKKYITDDRYIKIDGKPIIMVYAPHSIPNFSIVVKTWRDEARRQGIGEILVWSKKSIFDDSTSEYINDIDAEFDFAPNGYGISGASLPNNSTVYDYRVSVNQLEDVYRTHSSAKPFYYSCMMCWDNSPRRSKGFAAWDNYSTEFFYKWLRMIMIESERRLSPKERFVFVNAWNEWGEGTYLEPDRKYGYANINTLSKAIYNIPFELGDNEIILNDDSPSVKKSNLKIAIQIHAFFLDILPELLEKLSNIDVSYDLFITTDTQSKKIYILNLLKDYKLHFDKMEIMVVKNIGRDVWPFLKQMSTKYKKYDIIGHFHTKKSTTSPYGDFWRNDLYNNLIGEKKYFRKVLQLFNDKDIGLVCSRPYEKIANNVITLSETDAMIINNFLGKLGLSPIDTFNILPIFPAGTMFWCQSACLKTLFSLKLKEKDFPEEAGQLDGTTAHAVERLIGITSLRNNYKNIYIINKTS